jgi:hypothetical protein
MRPPDARARALLRVRGLVLATATLAAACVPPVIPGASVSPASFQRTASVARGPFGPAPATATIRLDAEPEVTLLIEVAISSTGLESFGFGAATTTTAEVLFAFKDPRLLHLPPGTYADTATIQVCVDFRCEHPVAGSPATVDFTYTVTP